jgi:type IV pilus assembly protein PilZ
LIEQRRYARTPIDAALSFALKGVDEWRDGIAKDVAIGGMFVETASPADFGAEVRIRVQLPGGRDRFELPGVVRWVRPGGMGVQFGLLGARETHVITEIGRQHARSRG